MDKSTLKILLCLFLIYLIIQSRQTPRNIEGFTLAPQDNNDDIWNLDQFGNVIADRGGYQIIDADWMNTWMSNALESIPKNISDKLNQARQERVRWINYGAPLTDDWKSNFGINWLPRLKKEWLYRRGPVAARHRCTRDRYLRRLAIQQKQMRNHFWDRRKNQGSWAQYAKPLKSHWQNKCLKYYPTYQAHFWTGEKAEKFRHANHI